MARKMLIPCSNAPAPGEWEINGIRGRGAAPPRCAGHFKGLAVVMATGWSVWQDLAAFDPEARGADVIAINNMILHWKKRVHHGVSLHAEEPPLWRKLRQQYGCDNSHVTCHAYRASQDPQVMNCDYTWPMVGCCLAGTSSLFAVAVGLGLGYGRIVLAGVPLDAGGHFYDPPGTVTKLFAGSPRREWETANKIWFQDRVRSLSGWTRELLGEPTEEWLGA